MKQHNADRTVLVGGCFDILHFGHISFLKQAKQLGDHLVVWLESDDNVQHMKGSCRPIHTQKLRKEMLESLSFVDEVVLLPPLSGNKAYMDLVQALKPDVIAITQGDEFHYQKKKQADSVNAKLVVIPKVYTPSTSQLAKLIGLE